MSLRVLLERLVEPYMQFFNYPWTPAPLRQKHSVEIILLLMTGCSPNKMKIDWADLANYKMMFRNVFCNFLLNVKCISLSLLLWILSFQGQKYTLLAPSLFIFCVLLENGWYSWCSLDSCRSGGRGIGRCVYWQDQEVWRNSKGLIWICSNILLLACNSE